VPRLFDALALARGDGRHARLLKNLARVELLILDLCCVRSYVELTVFDGFSRPCESK